MSTPSTSLPRIRFAIGMAFSLPLAVALIVRSESPLQTSVERFAVSLINYIGDASFALTGRYLGVY